MKKLYFLGPNGTNCELAAKKIKTRLNLECKLLPVTTISKIVNILENDEEALGILPIENSIEGIVRPTIDNLYLSDSKIILQTELEIKHCLFSKGTKEQIKNIVSHPQALAQCQKYILENFDANINLIESSSTAAALNYVLQKDETFAAIGMCELGNELKYNLIDENIADNKENKTRFILVSKKEFDFGEKKRTSIVFNTKNEPGALLSVLEIFKKHNLNLIYLESRPSKIVFGEYNFFADIDCGIDEIQDVLLEIKQACNFYKMLGSYFSV